MRRFFTSHSGTSISWISHMWWKGSYLVHLCCILYPTLKIACHHWKSSTSVSIHVFFLPWISAVLSPVSDVQAEWNSHLYWLAEGIKQKMLPGNEQDTLLFLDFYFGLELSWVTFPLTHLTKLCRYKNICSVRAESSHCLPQPQFLENVLLCLHILISYGWTASMQTPWYDMLGSVP